MRQRRSHPHLQGSAFHLCVLSLRANCGDGRSGYLLQGRSRAMAFKPSRFRGVHVQEQLRGLTLESRSANTGRHARARWWVASGRAWNLARFAKTSRYARQVLSDPVHVKCYQHVFDTEVYLGVKDVLVALGVIGSERTCLAYPLVFANLTRLHAVPLATHQ